jgi:peptidoglycan/LPS O-acetylase OafA/YrhL
MITALKKNYHFIFNPNNNRSPFLDGIRAVFTIYGVFYHLLWFSTFYVSVTSFQNFVANKHLDFLFKGDLITDIIFTLSGFLIANILFAEHMKHGKINIPEFFAKRAARLMPIYFFALFVAYILCITLHIPYLGNPSNVWANLLYVNNYLPAGTAFMHWTWSLAAEEQFFLLFPLLLIAMLGVKKYIPVMATLSSLFIMAIIIIALVVSYNDFHLPLIFSPHLGVAESAKWTVYFEKIYAPTYTQFGSVICGIIAAYLHRYYHQELESFFNKYQLVNLSILITALIILFCIYIVPSFDNVEFSNWFSLLYLSLYKVMYSFSLSMIILILHYPSHPTTKILHRILSAKFLYPIAQLSYSVALFHPLIIFLIFPYFFNEFETPTVASALVAAMLVFTLSFSIAIVTQILIERPIITTCANIFKRRKTKVAFAHDIPVATALSSPSD